MILNNLENVTLNDDDSFLVDAAIYYVKSSYYDTTAPKEDSSGKDAQTKFSVLFYDENSNTSVVKWQPLTGRTHQIRVHLKYIGHPIANDAKYGGETYNDFDINQKNAHEETKFEDEEGLYTPSLIDNMWLRFWLHAHEYIYKENKKRINSKGQK